jgi:hypothetical protein
MWGCDRCYGDVGNAIAFWDVWDVRSLLGMWGMSNRCFGDVGMWGCDSEALLQAVRLLEMLGCDSEALLQAVRFWECGVR